MPETITRILLFPLQLLVFLLLIATAILWVPLMLALIVAAKKMHNEIDLEPEYGDYLEPGYHRYNRSAERSDA